MYLEAIPDATDIYSRDGFLFPVDVLTCAEAAAHRARMEDAEVKFGALHYRSKVHTILRSPCELATHPRVLDVVERLIGPDILLHNVTYIIKEPRSATHVSWHQDLTYWGFQHQQEVPGLFSVKPVAGLNGRDIDRLISNRTRHLEQGGSPCQDIPVQSLLDFPTMSSSEGLTGKRSSQPMETIALPGKSR